VVVHNLYCERGSGQQETSGQRQKINNYDIHKTQKNISGNKIIFVYKIIGVDKILASTKYMRQQNLGVNEKLAQAQENLLTVRLGKSAADDFSQAPLKISYFSLMMVLLSVHAVVK
jgi:hypothetical protein